MDVAEGIKLAGGIAGLVALIWRVIDEFGSYLRISLEVGDPKGDWVTALTTVDNKGNRTKSITYAFLLIGPERESPLHTARMIAEHCGYQGQLRYTNDLIGFRRDKPEILHNRALIPTNFYYTENVDVADETLTYRASLPLQGWTRNTSYSVRFFVFPKGRLHRSTHDLFVYLDVDNPSRSDISDMSAGLVERQERSPTGT